MKKKIAFVIQRYGEEVIGGSESHCRAVAEHLTSLYDVDVLTTCALDYYDWKNHFPEGVTNCNGVEAHRFLVEGFRQHRSLHRMEKILFTQPHSLEEERLWLRCQGPISPALYRRLETARAGYAAVIFFTYLYATTVDGITIAPERSILVPTAHDESPLYLAIYRPVFDLPKIIFYNTENEKLLVQRIFQNQHVPSEIVGTGVNIPESQVQHQSGKPFLLYLGRVDINKGIKELAEWFSSLPIRNVELAIAGAQVMELPQLPKLRMLGQVSEGEKADLLQRCWGVIIPSRRESLSLVALEAWAHRKPVLARRGCAVLEEHLGACDGGLLFDDAASLYNAVRQLLANPEIAEKMGDRGWNYVMQKYSWDRIIRTYQTAIEGVSQETNVE